MKKNKGIGVLIATAAVIALLAFTTIVGFGPKKTGAAEHIKLGLDLAGGVSITYQAQGDKITQEAMDDTIYKLQKRVDQYSTEATVYQEGDDRINIEIPGVSDANKVLTELGKPGSLYFIAHKDAEGNENYTLDTATGEYKLTKELSELQENGGIVLNGTDVSSAKAGQYEDQQSGATQYVVELTLTKEGTTKFAKATKTAFEAGRDTIGIYYDDTFVSVPSVNGEISGGTAEITGMASFEEAENLASTIRIGGLQLELHELRSNVVGAQLGEEAVSTSLKAGAIGLAIVIIFMCIVYLIPGFASGLALLIYTGLTLVVLNAFDITLTLPGIAGIILSIGMAVDANVIIFARVREELAAGRTVRTALKTGFEKALSAIIDGNVTTLIAALVLGLKGTGSVKGFAQTLALGIVLSMFTAIFVTKFIVNALYAVGFRDVKFYNPKSGKGSIDFLAKKKDFFAFSIAIMVIGFGIMGFNASQGKGAFNYSLDFKGGTSTNVTFDKEYTLKEVDAEIIPVIEKITGDKNVQQQIVKGTTQVIFKTQTLDLKTREELSKALVEQFGAKEDQITTENISSTVSKEMRADAVVAVAIAAICMLLYIWFRFSDIRFATSAVTALIHDVLVVIAFYGVARISVGTTFIACMLTIVGYSINATIVIFDRIREELKTIHGVKTKEKIQEVVNRSITRTLTRSIYTSLTTFIMVAVLYVMGVSSIKEFALPLMVGIVWGAYSSVCITGSLWYLMKTKIGKNKIAE